MALSIHKIRSQFMKDSKNIRQEIKLAKLTWGNVSRIVAENLVALLNKYQLSIRCGDLLLLEQRWYVTNSGLLRIAADKRCHGIRIQPVREFCDVPASRYAFKAIVYTSPRSKGFVGYGDADPTNVSPLVRGAEMRVAETRAVNRALRKAYGIGLCSVEEIGSFAGPVESGKPPKKRVQPAAGNRTGGEPRLRDRLCQLIRQQQLDPVLVKSYALEFCRTKTLNEASRDQIENFVIHLADWAAKDKNALLCQLNSYVQPREGAA